MYISWQEHMGTIISSESVLSDGFAPVTTTPAWAWQKLNISI